MTKSTTFNIMIGAIMTTHSDGRHVASTTTTTIIIIAIHQILL